MNLQEARQRIPELEGLDDASAIDVIHQAYYPDMDKADLSKKLGYEPPKPIDDSGNFSRGFKQSLVQIPETLGGATALAGDVVGSDGLRDYGMGIYQKNHARDEALSKESDSFSSALGGNTSLADFASHGTGYVAGQALTALVTGGVGGFIGKQLAMRGIKTLAEREIESQVAKQAAELAIKRGVKVGAGTALFGSNLAQEAGSIYPDAVDQANSEGRTLDAGDKARIIGSSLAAAGVETLTDAKMFKGIAEGGRGPGESLLRAARREVPKAVVREAGTEGIQTGLERFGAGQDMTTADAIRDYVDSAALGGLGGGLGGAVASIHAQKLPDTGPLSRAANAGLDDKILQLTHDPDPLISFPDGSVGHKADFETYINSLPEDQRIPERAKLLGMGEKPADQKKPEATSSSPEASAANIAAWSARHEPATLDYAQSLIAAPGAKGLNLMVVPHGSGKGYTVVPSKWLSLDEQAKAGALQKGDAAKLPSPDRTAPDGNIIVDSAGKASKETYADKAAASAGKRSVEEAAKQRELLGKQTPKGEPRANDASDVLSNDAGTAAGNAAVEGDQPAGNQEVAPPANDAAGGADAAVQDRPDANAAEPAALILNPKGKPFVTEFSAKRKLKEMNLAETHEVAPAAEGGFVVQPKRVAAIDAAAHEAATSPTNDLPEPTQAQKEAGNYRKGHLNLHGLDISIENPAGSTRSGVNRSGKSWTNTMRHHYGYIKGTVGADKDHIDTFIGNKPESQKVFVVDQIHPDTGKFDEHKVILGAGSLAEAKKIYSGNYAKGWKGGKDVTETSVEGFKAWLKDGDTKQPFAESESDNAASYRVPGEVNPDEDENAPQWGGQYDVVTKGKPDLKGWREIGINPDGNRIYEAGGMRRVVDGDYAVTEKSHKPRERRNAEFRTNDELKKAGRVPLGDLKSSAEKVTVPAKKKAKTGAQVARDRLKQSNPFLAFLANEGISPEDRADIGIEKGRKGNRMVPGYGPVFRGSGKRLDELALKAVEAGHLTQADIDNPNDTGGTRRLSDMIHRAVAGKEVIHPASSIDATADIEARNRNDTALLAEAQALGIDVEGKSADQVYDAVAETHAEQEAARQAVEATSVEEFDAIESYTDGILPYASDDDLDALLDNGTTDTATGMRALGFTEDEINEELARERAQAQTGAGADESAERGAAQSGVERETPTGRKSASEVDPFSLSPETAAEARARIDAESQRQADKKAAKEKAERKAQADAEVGEFSLTGSDRPADANPNQEPLFSRRESAFYSQLERSISAAPAKIDNSPATQWKLWLFSNASKLGIKADEIQWSGITDYLDLMGKQKLSKDQIGEYLSQNGVQVQEVVKGGAGTVVSQADIDAAERRGDWDEYDRLTRVYEDQQLGTNANGTGNETKYAQYTLPGGENYRELLLTLPVERRPEGDAAALHYENFIRRGGEPEWKDLSSARQQEIARDMPQVARNVAAGKEFNSGHWDEPNILAHIRFNDRTDADGKRVLFIEELQSDWGQEGKKKGFAATAAERAEADAMMKKIDSVGGLHNLSEADRARARELGAAITREGVQNGPFITDTKSWLSLGIKRMIRYAAENGYDRIAFINGEQSANRYDLSKQISRVVFDDNNSGGISKPKMDGEPSRGMLRAYDLNGNEVVSSHVEPEEVENYVGKEAAKKLFEQQPQESRSAGLGVRRRELKGLDLKVGGEGMKTFYDKIVPQAINDVLKKVGGGKTISVDIGMSNNGAFNLQRPDGTIVGDAAGPYPYTSRQSAQQKAKQFERAGESGLKVVPAAMQGGDQPGFDVTPEMRDQAMQGLPLFDRGGMLSMGMEKTDVQSEVKRLTSAWKNAPGIKVAQSVSDLPFKAPNDARGAYHAGSVYLVADNLNSEEEVQFVLFHESLGHAGLQGFFGDELNAQLKALERDNENIRAAAAKWREENKKDLRDNYVTEERWEAASIEEVLADIAGSGVKISGWGRFRAFVQKLLRAVGFVFMANRMESASNSEAMSMLFYARRNIENGIAAPNLSEFERAKDDNRRSRFIPERMQALSRTPNEGDNALRALAENDELFRLPKSQENTVEGIVKDIAPDMEVKKLTNIPGETRYNFTMPDGRTARMVIRPENKYGNSIYGFDMQDGNMHNVVDERPGKNIEHVEGKDDVWIDVSLLNEGGGFGAKMYAIASNYAHNTGKVFIGDPAGLSDEALRRRPEQMLSSALKFGTTEHLGPHPRQITGDKALGVPGLDWVYGDHVGNIEKLIRLNLQNIETAGGNGGIVYNPEKGRFEDSDGNDLSREEISGLAKSGLGRRAHAGGDTLARAALLRALSERTGIAADRPDDAGTDSARRVADARSDASAGTGRQAASRDAGNTAGAGGIRSDAVSSSQDRKAPGGGTRGMGLLDKLVLLASQQTPATKGIFYSRASVADNPVFSRAANAADSFLGKLGVQEDVRNKVSDLFQSQKTFNGWWHKTVGTQYHKAQVDKHFKRVYDAVQRYLSNVSAFANDAADAAPTLLPKMDGLRDLTKKPVSKADSVAVGKAVFTGTLTDQKVYSDAELRNKHGLNDGQIALYREFRAATDKSLDDMGKTDMLRYAGADGKAVTDLVMDAPDVSTAADILGKHLENLDQADVAEIIRDKAQRIAQLKQEGYAPLMRFGEHTVYVTDKKGNQLFFGMAESGREAAALARDMRETYPDADVTQGILSKEGAKLFSGISPDTIEVFAQTTGLDKNPLFQDYLKLVVNNRSALKRLIHRKGVAGFSQDTTRVLASFLTSNARASSKNLHAGEMTAAANDIPKEKGDVRDEAIKLVNYIQNPVEEAAKVRGLLFTNFIGGSIASAAVNMTQPVMMTLPYLSQFGGAVRATKELASAMKMAATTKSEDISDAGLRAAMMKAESEGIVSPQEIHNLQAEAQRSSKGFSIGGKEVVPAFAMRKIALVWGGFFGLAEQFNRRTTFIAAYNVAKGMTPAQIKKAGVANAYEFAAKSIAETQGVYNRGNRPDWARGALGATLMTFKQYSISYLEFLKRLPPKERALALAILAVAAGANGLPFADDLDDIIDTIGQALGYNFNSKKTKERFITSTLGQGAADFILHGASGVSGMPLDVSLRMGMGNLLPGTALLKPSNTDKSYDYAEFFGAAGGYGNKILKAGDKALQGDAPGALLAMASTATTNLVKAVDMMENDSYRDSRGRKVVDTDLTDAIVKGIGFQPGNVAQEQKKLGIERQDIDMANAVKADIADKWAQGVFEGNPDAVQAAREKMREWNEKNPEARITVNAAQVARRVREMRMSKRDRVIKHAPKIMRAGLRENRME